MIEDAIGHGRTWTAPVFNAQHREQKLADPDVIENMWKFSRPITEEDAAGRYLRGRGITPPFSSVLRLHEALWYFNDKGERTGSYPAIVAAIQAPSGEVVALHRTYLQGINPPTKLQEKLTKATIKNGFKGAAIRLHKPSDVLAVGEGIETALSYAQLFNVPSWACMNTWGLENVEIPDQVRTVHIAIDNDDAGRNAAQKLAIRLAKRQIQVIQNPLPEWLRDRKGADWNDVIRSSSNES